MPILHGQYSGDFTQPDGTKVPLPPDVALVQQGPVVQISLGLAETLANQLIAQSRALPAPIAGFGMIDTGASVTCVDDAIAQQMGLPVIDVVQMISASHPSTPANVYPIQLEIMGSPIRVQVARAMGANLTSQGIIALLGRDFLRFCCLIYTGPFGHITLTIQRHALKLLLDTHAFLWWIRDDESLGGKARKAIANERNHCFLSMASCWEMTLKKSLGKLEIPEPVDAFVAEQLAANRFTLLPIDLRHVSYVSRLAFHHRDPFDRLLVAQAMEEDLAIASADPIFRKYGIENVWQKTIWAHFSPEKELAQAAAMARAAKTAGVRHVIWSTLEDTRELVSLGDDRMPTLMGKYKVPHFDAKGEANHFFTDLGVPTTFLLTSF